MIAAPDGIEIRPATADEMPALLATEERAFGEDVRADRAPLEIALLEPKRSLAAFDGAALVATAGIYTFDMTVPGGPRPVAGVTWVGVLPTHHRRGILSALMRRQLTDLFEAEQEPVAALWASEPGIYRRFGYGLGSKRLSMKVQSGLSYVAGAPASAAAALRMIGMDEARTTLRRIHDEVRATRPGMISRSDSHWNRLFHDPPDGRDGASSLTCVVPEDGKGYLIYRTKGDFGNQWIANGVATVRELIATDTAAAATLWRYALDLDLMASVDAWNRPLDDPLQHLVTDPRRLRMSVGDALWVRIVDLPRALTARTYGDAGSVVLDVVDDVCPWNAGRYRLDVGAADGSQVSVARTEETADITLSAVQLGSAYLGGVRLRELAAAGFVDEHTPGAVTRADRLFAGQVEPWCPEVF